MSNVSAYAEKAMLDWVLLGATPTRPGTVAVGLSLGAPTSVSGSEMGTASGYTRKTATFGAAASPAGSATLAAAVTFGPFQTAYSITAPWMQATCCGMATSPLRARSLPAIRWSSPQALCPSPWRKRRLTWPTDFFISTRANRISSLTSRR